MKIIFWGVTIFGAVYSFGHAFYLFKEKNKLGALGIVLVAFSILVCSFFIRLK